MRQSRQITVKRKVWLQIIYVSLSCGSSTWLPESRAPLQVRGCPQDQADQGGERSLNIGGEIQGLFANYSCELLMWPFQVHRDRLQIPADEGGERSLNFGCETQGLFAR